MPLSSYVAAWPESLQATYIVFCAAAFYIFTYFAKTPYFMLPEAYLKQPVHPGSQVDVQTAFALAQSIGYVVAKPPAVVLMSSPFYFRNRAACVASSFGLAVLFSGGGFW